MLNGKVGVTSQKLSPHSLLLFYRDGGEREMTGEQRGATEEGKNKENANQDQLLPCALNE